MPSKSLIPPKQRTIFDLRAEREAKKPLVHHHDWETHTELLRRSLTPAEQEKLDSYNRMFPGNDGNQTFAAELTYQTCKDRACGMRRNTGYRI